MLTNAFFSSSDASRIDGILLITRPFESKVWEENKLARGELFSISFRSISGLSKFNRAVKKYKNSSKHRCTRGTNKIK